MARRTYLPTLVRMLHWVCRYITRYETVIRANLTSGQILLLEAVLAACAAFTNAVELPEGV